MASINLNPYKIFWGIVKLEDCSFSSSNAKRLSEIARASVNKNDTFMAFHGAKDYIEERFKNVLNYCASAGLSGSIYKITDAQYGLISNSWNGSVPKLAEPFNHNIILKKGKTISNVPLTEIQFNNCIKF